jgi:hypothetical protein
LLQQWAFVVSPPITQEGRAAGKVSPCALGRCCQVAAQGFGGVGAGELILADYNERVQ